MKLKMHKMKNASDFDSLQICNRSVKKHESSIIVEQSLNSIIFKKEKKKKKQGYVLIF